MHLLLLGRLGAATAHSISAKTMSMLLPMVMMVMHHPIADHLVICAPFDHLIELSQVA